MLAGDAVDSPTADHQRPSNGPRTVLVLCQRLASQLRRRIFPIVGGQVFLRIHLMGEGGPGVEQKQHADQPSLAHDLELPGAIASIKATRYPRGNRAARRSDVRRDRYKLEKNTGSVNRNNNDHGISFDGRSLAISSQREGLPGGGSTVYILPIEGGNPAMVTENTPSYWHGWAPNNKEVVYVAQRNNIPIYNIYRNSISGGKEVALTTNKKGEHVDGCEYSPDGKYIYFNASYSGTMQIWRMKPDGTGREQLTFDEYNNWFPHISPDGKWMVFISFLPDIEVNSHPSYKRVMLRLMSLSGGAPRVIAYLYGGQGTINVPSWSPDSKSIGFVSNSGK